MRLNDRQILECLDNKEIIIEPRPDNKVVTGVSIDLTLGDEFRVFKSHKVISALNLGQSSAEISSIMEDITTKPIKRGQEGFSLAPGGFALGVTHESVTLPSDIVGWLDGRSSLARLGLMVHATAHRIDPGWSGNIVLEFCNAGPLHLILIPGMSIGALNFERLDSECLHPYTKRENAKYKHQKGAVASKIADDNN